MRRTSAGNAKATRHYLPGLLYTQQLDIEDQRGIRRNHPAGAACAIAELGRDRQGALASHLHSGDALVPAGNDLVCPEGELTRLAAVDRAVELCPLGAVIEQPA